MNTMEISQKNKVRGYKVFNPDWICEDKQYSCPGKFEEEGKFGVVTYGMRFYQNPADCFNYYKYNSNNKVAEVLAYGEVITRDKNSYTNKLEIVREVTWDEILQSVDFGKNCTGLKNLGDDNAGNRNVGDGNTGTCNSGNSNTGSWNTGNYNTGDGNTGDGNTGTGNTGQINTGNYNVGSKNTGDYNTGSFNTGDWNKSSYNTGCFNTIEQTIMLFNKPSNITYRQWHGSEAKHLLSKIPNNPTKWVKSEDMTNEEQKRHPEYKVVGGYLKTIDVTECRQNWWDNLSNIEKYIIKSIPNFDQYIFWECTGIKI